MALRDAERFKRLYDQEVNRMMKGNGNARRLRALSVALDDAIQDAKDAEQDIVEAYRLRDTATTREERQEAKDLLRDALGVRRNPPRRR